MVPPRPRPVPAGSATPARQRRPVVLLTGFDAFGAIAANPSGLAARALHGKQVAGHRIVGAVLPTVFDASTTLLHQLLARHAPALVVCAGVAAGRHALSVERVAINRDDAPIPDNTGYQPHDRPVVADGPAAYLSTLPVQAMVHALQQNGLAAELSPSAGHYVCNHLFYQLMHALAREPGVGWRGGFIHVPPLEVMALEHTVRGLRLALRCALTVGADTPVA